jgi:hypothetical protein
MNTGGANKQHQTKEIGYGREGAREGRTLMWTTWRSRRRCWSNGHLDVDYLTEKKKVLEQWAYCSERDPIHCCSPGSCHRKVINHLQGQRGAQSWPLWSESPCKKVLFQLQPIDHQGKKLSLVNEAWQATKDDLTWSASIHPYINEN